MKRWLLVFPLLWLRVNHHTLVDPLCVHNNRSQKVMSTSSSRQWSVFLSELDKQGIEFDAIRNADEGSRGAVLESMSAVLPPLDRAVVSSMWAQQASREGAGASSPSYQSPSGISSSQPQPRSLGFTLPVPLSPGEPVDVNALRDALARGDCTVALPLASELLQQDGIALCEILHEYLPHVSPVELRGMLGVGGAPVPIPVTGQQRVKAQRQFHERSDAEPNDSPATMNGAAISVGQVLTASGLASKFGAGFIATCNGAPLSLPHCVQDGDSISVRQHNQR